MKQDQLSNSNIEKQPVAFTNLNHSGTSYAQNALEHVPAKNSINEEATDNLAKQVLQNKENDIEK
ncbi:hypothetical protein RB620_13570 [Paenibacillus sp. LHD-117]|uniref:hypothetical protein n=1 Tax=Paenibacillus sp. LHD-117 TaxID=3071412 RepID=UPI0027DF2E58|nr:hypothetical protein [Paenibacillus sp. LHD-117]MDQ6420467.1 hypothetical protein [Paenibacillus sp. LHD-117]